MKKARISELKNRLSYFLQFVRRGQSVLVYDRDQVIARIDPVGARPILAGEDWIAELERTGGLRPPTASLPDDWLKRRPVMKTSVTQALLEERESGQ